MMRHVMAAVSVSFLLLIFETPAAAGSYNGLQPGVSTKEDADHTLGAPVRELVPGERYDYAPSGDDIRRVSIRFDPRTRIIETLDIYFIAAYPRARFVEWFALGIADEVTVDAYGNRIEHYAAQAMSLHFEGPTESSRVVFIRHRSAGSSSQSGSRSRTESGLQSRGQGGETPKPRARAQPYLGVLLAKHEGQGYRVVDVQSDSPAHKAGIQSGDVILELEGESFYESRLDPNTFDRLIATMSENQPLRILIQRGNRRFDVNPVLEAGDPAEGQAELRSRALDYYNRGAALADSGKCKTAIPLLEKATLYNPKDVGALELLGFCEYRRGHHEEAYRIFQRVLGLAPGSPMANYFVAAHYEELQNREKAILHYGLYLANDDGDAFRLKYARKHLGQLTGSRTSADWDRTMGVFLTVLEQELSNGFFGTGAGHSEALKNALEMVRQQSSSDQQQEGVTVDQLWKMYEAIRRETKSDHQ